MPKYYLPILKRILKILNFAKYFKNYIFDMRRKQNPVELSATSAKSYCRIATKRGAGRKSGRKRGVRLGEQRIGGEVEERRMNCQV